MLLFPLLKAEFIEVFIPYNTWQIKLLPTWCIHTYRLLPLIGIQKKCVHIIVASNMHYCNINVQSDNLVS